MLASAGIQLAHAAVGDPDPVTAVCDELDRWEADELLLCTHGRGFVGFRTARVTGLPVDHVLAPFAGRNGHCVAAAA